MSGKTRQQQRQHEVQQPQPRQEESPGASAGGGGGGGGGKVPAHLFMEADLSNVVQEVSNRNFYSGEDRSCLLILC